LFQGHSIRAVAEERSEGDSFEVVVHADEPGDAQVVEDLHAEGVGDEPRYRLKAFSGVVPDTVSATPGRLPNAAIVVSLSPLLECAGMNGSGTASLYPLTNDWREGVVSDALAEALTATLAGQSLSSSSSSP
jgi:hypothetical protein